MLLTPLQASRLSLPQGESKPGLGNPYARGLVYSRNPASSPAGETRVGVKRVATPLGVADGFGSLGTGSTDSIDTGFSAHSVERTYVVAFDRRGGGGGGLGRVFEKRVGGAQVENLFVTSSQADTLAYGRTFSGGGGEWWIPIPTSGVVVLAISYSSASTSNAPTAYINGLPVAVSQRTAASGTVVNNSDNYVVGNRKNDNARNWDGWIGPLHIINRLYSEDELRAVTANPALLFQADDLDLEPYYVAGGGPQVESGGSTSFIDVLSAGAGTALELASGGSASLVAVLAAGSGSAADDASGGSASLVNVTATGAGQAREAAQGGSTALIDVSAVGAGLGSELASGGSASLIEVTSSGAGTEGAVTAGGSSSVVAVISAGAGVAALQASGGSSATVIVTPSGAGLALEIAIGGSSSRVAVSAAGAGYEGDAPPVAEVPPQRRLIAIPGGSTAFFVPSTSTEFSALDF